MNLGKELCLECGLCCDGTLFDNVRLSAKDFPEKMKANGLPVRTSRAKTPVIFMHQPCTALCADCTCRIYKQRPASCREFECGVYKETRAGRMTIAEALKWIRQAQRLATSARRCLAQLENEPTSRSLHDRFRAAQKRLEQLGDEEGSGECFSKLGLLMHRLHLLAHERFYTRPEGK